MRGRFGVAAAGRRLCSRVGSGSQLDHLDQLAVDQGSIIATTLPHNGGGYFNP